MDRRREQPQAKRQRENRDAGSSGIQGMVRVADFPTLKLLCWSAEAPCITRRNAFALYERNWRWFDVAGVPEHERELIDDLAREFGRGLINA